MLRSPTGLGCALSLVLLSACGGPEGPDYGRVSSFSGSSPCDGTGSLFTIVIDADMIDKDVEGVEDAGRDLGVDPERLINKDNPTENGNPTLRWSASYSGSIVELPTGQPGDEGIFALPPTLRGKEGTFSLADYVAGSVRQSRLDEVRDVFPVDDDAMENLVGQRFVAIAYDSDVSFNDSPPQANLQGSRLGLFYFTVLGLAKGDDHPNLVLRVDPPSADAPADSADVMSGSVSCDESPKSCSEAYSSVNNGPLPSGCVKISGGQLGSSPVSMGTTSIALDPWTSKSPSEYVAFAYTPSPNRELYVSTKAGPTTYVDDGDGVWAHPDGLSGSVNAISNVVFCPCNETSPSPGPVCGDGTVDSGEACDDGDEADGDGCSADCS